MIEKKEVNGLPVVCLLTSEWDFIYLFIYLFRTISQEHNFLMTFAFGSCTLLQCIDFIFQYIFLLSCHSNTSSAYISIERIVLLDFIHRLVSQKIEE
jgi:hypothetical protein